MNAIDAAKKVVEKFGTGDCFVIAEKADVRIVYGDWHPATVGEYDRKTKTICVNRRAVTSGKYSAVEIVAHELGHFFAAEFDFDRKTEEAFAAAFADQLLKRSEVDGN